MKIEVLLSTMNQTSLDVAKSLNIQTDAIIVNQTKEVNYQCENINNNKIQMFSFNESGVGLSRNSALMRSDADICLMADDDMKYVEGYENMVKKAFEENPDADILLFDVQIEDSKGNLKTKINKKKRIKYHNYMKFGTVNIAFRRKAIVKNNIYFSLLFGGGAKYGSGEDTLFLTECLKKNLCVYSIPVIIAEIKYRPSSWFTGYNEKYFKDKGALFYSISPTLCYLIALQFILRRKDIVKKMGRRKVMDLFLSGIKECSNY